MLIFEKLFLILITLEKFVLFSEPQTKNEQFVLGIWWLVAY